MNSYGPWSIVLTFNDGSTYRQRAIYTTHYFTLGGVEERIFNPDGTLRPLTGGRTSPADTNP